MRRERKKDRSGNGSERGDGYSSGYFQQPNQQFGYDPYSAYYQNQQYYENLRLTNPAAYAEWYNRYFANQLSAAASAVAKVADGRGRESGRESVHSGRSSTKDNERYASFIGRFFSSFCFSFIHSNYDHFNFLVKFIKFVRLVFLLILVLCCCLIQYIFISLSQRLDRTNVDFAADENNEIIINPLLLFHDCLKSSSKYT